MGRERKLKGRIDGPTVTRVHSPKGNMMLQLVWKCTKTVTHPNTQKNVSRECEVTSNYVDPKSENWLEDALVICGGDASLAAKVFNFGLKSWVRQQETNRLGKVDEVSKGLAKAISGLMGTGMSEEAARTMLLANPELKSNLENAKFEQFTKSVIDDFSAYQLSDADEKGNKTSRFPDVTEVGGGEPEAKDDEVKS